MATAKIEWEYVAYKYNPPIPEYHILLTKRVRHMSPAQAQTLAAELLMIANYTEAEMKQ
jgi:hypothetical protein